MFLKGSRTHINQRSLAFIVLITGIAGGLLIVFSILLLCKYCLNRKNLKEAEQMKLLYETLNQTSFIDSNHLYHRGIRESSPLEPRRSNPLDRYQLPEHPWQIPCSRQISLGGLSYHESREQTSNKQHDSHLYGNISIDDDPTEQAYLQVDPRCYVRQNSNASLIAHRKSDTPRLEKGHSLNVDTRPLPSSTSLSPYRQSSFDVTLASCSPPQILTPSPGVSTQHEIYYTPRGSSLSVVPNSVPTPPSGSQHLSPPTPSTSRKNSIAIILEKKELTVTLDPSGQTSTVRSTIAQREHEHSRSLEHSLPPVQQIISLNNSTNDKQSRSFDAVHLLRPGTTRPDVVNRRTKSYEYADDRRPSTSSIAPLPIIIKIPDMTELVQAAQLSQLQQSRRESTEREEYQRNTSRKTTLVQQTSIDDHDDRTIASQDLWRLRQSYELEEQLHLDQTSPEEFSPDLLTSTSIDSAGAMPIHNKCNTNGDVVDDDDLSKYQHRRKSSSNLLLPPPEVRRQALRRTFEKRRSCINQSNARREQQLLNNSAGLDDENMPSMNPVSDFSSLLNNFNSKSENSSFERSLETDFDMQSDTSSRGPNDQFTSIESSGNENAVPDLNHRVISNRRQQPPPPQQQSPQISPHQDDSGYKSLESQNSQNRTFSLDWMSADGAESVIYMGESRLQQRSVDVKDLDDDLAQQEHEQRQQITNNQRGSKLLYMGLHHSYQEASLGLTPPVQSNSNMMQQRSLSTNIPLVDHYTPTPINLLLSPSRNPSNSINKNKLVTSSSFTRTASKKRREFGKDKRNALSNVGLPHTTTTTNEHHSTVYQINKIKTKSSSSLQVRHPDLRRTKSDESKILESSENDSTLRQDETNSNTGLSSSTDGILVSIPSPSCSPNPIRQHLSPNTDHCRPILQRSPSSTTPPVTTSPQIEAFRSQRGSVSFDTQTPSNISPSANKSKTSTTYSILPTCITKPRLKFSMVRDTAMANFGHHVPTYSMPITRDYSIDEKTNRIVNEFLMHDPSLDDKKRNPTDDRGAAKRHHHRIRPKTFDEINPNKQTRAIANKQRHYNLIQANIRRHSQHQYPSVHLTDNIEQEEEEEEEEDSSDPTSPLLILNQQSVPAVRRDNNMIAGGSPSIIITGDDSGSC